MTDTHFVSLCSLLGTKDRMHAFVASLDSLLAHSSQSTAFSLSEDFFSQSEYILLKELVKNYTDLKTLRKQLFEVPVFTVQISFNPSKLFMTKLLSLLQSSISDPFLLDTIVNPGIIGGCVIEFRGMYSDKSLKRDITKWMKARAPLNGR